MIPMDHIHLRSVNALTHPKGVREFLLRVRREKEISYSEFLSFMGSQKDCATHEGAGSFLSPESSVIIFSPGSCFSCFYIGLSESVSALPIQTESVVGVSISL